MHDLTQRQVEILKNLIEEYIETAEPVGSETLEKKYSLSASPATIRNEMVKLTDLGYLKKPHTSAGRVPTPLGMKFYVRQLMREKEPSVAEEIAVKEKVWDFREQEARFMKELTKQLADKTKALAIATTERGDIYCAGYANILEMPEFFDIDVTRSLLSVIDEFEYFHDLFANVIGDDEEVHILLEDELGPRLQGPYGFIYTHYEISNSLAGEVGVLGPTRLRYSSIIPTIRSFKHLIQEIAKEWK